MKNNQLLIIGDGMLAAHVHRLCLQSWRDPIVSRRELTSELARAYRGSIKLAVVLQDGWDPVGHEQADRILRAEGIAWLRGFVLFGEALIGPLVLPHEPGCSQCADARYFMTMEDRNEIWRVKSQRALHHDDQRDAYASQPAMMHTAYVVYNEIQKIVADSLPPTNEHILVTVNLKTLAVSRHQFLPHPRCPVCSSLPEDSPELAEIVLKPTPKRSNSFRWRLFTDLQQFLVRDYVDHRAGVLNAKVHDLIAPYAAVGVNLPLPVGDEGTSGRASTYPESELTAVLEGLERYCGIEPRGRRGFIFDTYANVRDMAVDPRMFGVHAPEQYAKSDFPFQPFADDVPLEWVWSYSLTQRQPVLIPKLLAYYSMGDEGAFVYETSNGCAVGASLVEAIFHGILEVAERDAFLMTWYAQLRLPRIAVSSIADEQFQLMVQRLQYAVGYELHLFNATMENGIPTVFAIARNLRDYGLNLLCAAGSHIDAVRAVKGAVHEIAGMLLRFDEKLDGHREAYLQMLYDASLVQEMDQHSMLYGLPEAEERLDFLLKGERREQSFQEAFSWPFQRQDLSEDVDDLVNTFADLDLNVIVVNQTSPELARNELHCVKVLIPGMLPMTFGHHLTRLEGLERVLRVPMELGYANAPLTQHQLNPHPHPFP